MLEIELTIWSFIQDVIPKGIRNPILRDISNHVIELGGVFMLFGGWSTKKATEVFC
jgi:hypothetical protein